MAAVLNISLPQYSKYELGRDRVTWARLLQICKALDITVLGMVGPLLPDNGGKTEPNFYTDILQSPYTVEMLTQWERVRPIELRKLLVELLRWIVRRRS